MAFFRREVLQLAAAAALTPVSVQAKAAKASLTARPGRMQLVPPGYPETEFWGYDGRMPGPEIRVAQGQRLARRFVNDLPQPSSIHWHGIRIDNAMDGVSGLTQNAVPPGGTFDYDFVVPDAGTFWFHAHHRSVEQVARGLYGALIVEEAETPDVDREEVLILDDWLLDPETAQILEGFDAMHARSHAGRWGNFVGTNGLYELTLPARVNERLRLRIVNAANARIFELGLSGLDGWIMALDGMPLAAPERFGSSIQLGPGQRVDLFVDVVAGQGEDAHLVHLDTNDAFSMAAFEVTGTASAARREPPPPLPPNPRMGVPGLNDARQMELRMEGGAMGRMTQAAWQGETRTMRELVRGNMFWAFNGVVGLSETPFARFDRGETVQMSLVNDTAFPHAMHLHGMHFRVLTETGALGPMRDTVLVPRGESRDIAFVADNPGKWLFHCHMLSHAASGMTTWIEVV